MSLRSETKRNSGIKIEYQQRRRTGFVEETGDIEEPQRRIVHQYPKSHTGKCKNDDKRQYTDR